MIAAMGKARGFDLPGAPRRATLSLAPLIDVTFILLIFFMLVSQFSRLAPISMKLEEIRVEAPQLATANGGGATKFILELRADGGFALGERQLAAGADLAQAVNELAQGLPPGANAEAPPPTLLLSPAPEAPLQILVDALIALQHQNAFAIRVALPPTNKEASQP